MVVHVIDQVEYMGRDGGNLVTPLLKCAVLCVELVLHAERQVSGMSCAGRSHPWCYLNSDAAAL